jgi:hypothetical protein
MLGRPFIAPKTHTATTIRTQATIGQIIFGLDDRNVLRALRLLEPVSESSDSAPKPDQQEGSRCVTCITRGE